MLNIKTLKNLTNVAKGLSGIKNQPLEVTVENQLNLLKDSKSMIAQVEKEMDDLDFEIKFNKDLLSQFEKDLTGESTKRESLKQSYVQSDNKEHLIKEIAEVDAKINSIQLSIKNAQSQLLNDNSQMSKLKAKFFKLSKKHNQQYMKLPESIRKQLEAGEENIDFSVLEQNSKSRDFINNGISIEEAMHELIPTILHCYRNFEENDLNQEDNLVFRSKGEAIACAYKNLLINVNPRKEYAFIGEVNESKQTVLLAEGDIAKEIGLFEWSESGNVDEKIQGLYDMYRCILFTKNELTEKKQSNKNKLYASIVVA